MTCYITEEREMCHGKKKKINYFSYVMYMSQVKQKYTQTNLVSSAKSFIWRQKKSQLPSSDFLIYFSTHNSPLVFL